VTLVGVALLFSALSVSSPASDPSSRVQRAREAVREGRYSEAIALWRTHLALRPGDDEARTAFARALALARRYAEAVSELRAVLGRHPKDVEVRSLLARVLAWSGDRAGAQREARDALTHDPAAPQAHLVLADILGWDGRPREALFHYEQALARMDDPEARKRYIRVLLAANPPTEAAREARRLSEADPRDLVARELLRAALEAGLVGRIEVAATAFEASKPHPWWRVQVSTKVRVTSGWELGGGAEHLWRDFGTGFMRDTAAWFEGYYRSPRGWNASFFVLAAPQATFSPRVSFEGTGGYDVVRGLTVGAGYKGFGFEGQYGHLLTSTLTWHWGNHYLSVRYYLSIVQPFDFQPTTGSQSTSRDWRPVPPSTQVGHSGSLRMGGDPLAFLGWYAGLAGGLAFITAGLGPTMNPAISFFAGLDLRPGAENGIRIEYEYMNEQLGSEARGGVTWHGLRLGYYRRF
jgi:tetratricopeptide (TPR) repeat protein